MEAPTKFLCLLGLLTLFCIAGLGTVDGAGECGKNTTPDNEALKLTACASAAEDGNASVSQSCCAQVKKIGQKPACLCAVLLSNTAKSAGVKPEVAITIPKRCNFADRPVGYKCGRKYNSSQSPMNYLGSCFYLIIMSFAHSDRVMKLIRRYILTQYYNQTERLLGIRSNLCGFRLQINNSFKHNNNQIIFDWIKIK